MQGFCLLFVYFNRLKFIVKITRRRFQAFFCIKAKFSNKPTDQQIQNLTDAKSVCCDDDDDASACAVA